MRVSLFVLALVALIVGIDAQRYFAEQYPAGVSWSPREKANIEYVRRTTTFRDGDNAGRAVSLTNYFLLYGGDTDFGPANDVWASSNGRNWYFVAGNADGVEHTNYPETFPAVSEAASCQDTLYRQYRAGGRRSGQVFNDVWMSIDGFTWREMTPAAEWDPVYLANMVGDASGAIYIAGGILDDQGSPRRSSGAVYRSANQGRTWVQQFSGYNAAGAPSGPGARAVSILLNADQNLIWMTGVNSGFNANDAAESYLKDVWVSTNSGRGWDPVNQNTPFGRRDDSNAEMASSGLIVLAGGYGGTGANAQGEIGEIYNDVWVSANGGYSWGLCVQDAEWDDRRYQMTLLDGDGYLWVMGGTSRDGRRYADVWKSLWTFADVSTTASRCRITVPACGAGLKCMPNGASTLVANDGTGVYCDACPYTFNASAATTVVIFLVVFIILFAIAVLALIYTYYKLRSAGAPSPIPLPATAQRWWNKSTNGAVGGSSDAGSTTNGDGLYQPLRIRDQV